MMGAADGRSIVTMAGNGTAYLYDGLADAYTVSLRPYTATTITGYYGPLAPAPDGSYYLMNGFVLNSSLSAIAGSESPSSTTTLPAASKRNIAAVSAVDANRFLRLTTPVKQTVSTTTTSDARTTLEQVDLRDNSVSLIGAMAENPATSVFGTTRANVPPRLLAVDSAGTAYILGLSGLTVVPATIGGIGKPQLATGSNAVLNAVDGSRNFAAGSFIVVSGGDLAAPAAGTDLPAPSVLGGSCVTFSDTSLPLLQTAPGQVVAQIPDTLAAGQYVMRVRSLAYGQQSDALVVTVQKR